MCHQPLWRDGHIEPNMNLVWISRLAQMATPVAVAAIIILSWLPGNERPHWSLWTRRARHRHALTAAGIAVGFFRRTLAILLALIGLAATLEIGQLWIPGRTSQLIIFGPAPLAQCLV